MENSKPIYHWLMILSLVLAASSFPVTAVITNDLPPSTMMFMRFLLAAALFAPYVFIKHSFKIPSWKGLFNYALLSVPLVVFFWCMFESLRHTSALNTGALYTMLPAITAICALFINKEMTSRFRSMGLFLGTIGALLIVFRTDYEAFMEFKLNYGDLIFIIGCLFLGLYNPLVKKIYRGEPMEVMTFWVLLSGAALLLIASWNEIINTDWYSIESRTFAGIFYLSLFSTLITFFLLQLCVIKIGATRAAAYGFLTPIFVIIISISIGMSQFELSLLPGMVLVFVAMLIIQRESTPALSKDT